jgi:hypothetical protein
LAGWIRGFLFFSSNSLIFWLASLRAFSAASLTVSGFNHSNSFIFCRDLAKSLSRFFNLASALNNSAEVLERFNKWF